MRFESLQVTGSFQVSGSARIPFGPSSSRTTQTGSLFFDTDNNRLEINRGNDWYSGSGAGNGGGGGVSFDGTTNYLIVAGGGAGGFRTTSKPFYMGGGGAGGLRSGSLTLTSGSSYTITVGAGGAAYAGGSTFGNGSSGGDSSIAGTGITTVTSTGGGYGSTIDHPSSDPAVSGQDGADGGSGGGATGWNNAAGTGGAGTVGQGNDGGDGTNGENAAGAGGGGAGGPGTTNSGVGGRDAGDGGPGVQSDITGTNTYYAAGARGGRGYSSVNGAEGADGTGYRGEANSGDGGLPQNTTAGESGVVIVSYDTGSAQGAGGIKGDDGSGNRYHQFNSSDSFVMGAVGDFDIVTDSLQAHWDAGNYDSRGTSTWTSLTGSSGFNGTITGATLGANWYYDFDGSDDKVTTNDNGALTNVDDLTVEMWARVEDNNDYRYLFSNLLTTSTQRQIYAYVSNADRIECTVYSGNNSNQYRAYHTAALASTIHNNWVHYVFVISAGLVSKIYLDTVDTSISIRETGAGFGSKKHNSATSDFVIGGNQNSGNTSGMNGRIGQVRVYHKVLTADEITQNYNATKTNFV